MEEIQSLIEAGDMGGAWTKAIEIEGRDLTYVEFLETYVWGLTSGAGLEIMDVSTT